MTSFDEYPSVQIQLLFSNNSESVILGELGLGLSPSLRFLGPTRGVLPIGPNGIRGLGALDAPKPSPLSDAENNAAIYSYNYTFNHQGLTSNISCIYDTESPIRFLAVPNDTSEVLVNGSCNEIGLTDVVTKYLMPDTSRTLAFWACKSIMSIPTGEQYPAYYIYLRGRAVYARAIGNISCTLFPIQPAVFPVTYQSSTGVFSTEERITASAPTENFSYLIEYALLVLRGVLQQAQTISVNLVASLVHDLGVQALELLPTEPDEQYLPLYEAMLQGILVDEVCTASNSSSFLLMVVPQLTYMRFLYSIMVDPSASSCLRTVNGTFSAEVTGWVAKPVHIGFLMPMTILNLASLIIVLISIARAKRSYEFDPTNPRPLLLAKPNLDESDDSGWADSVSYRSREVRECHI